MCIAFDPPGAPRRMQLKWAERWFISSDGTVSRADGTPAKAISLAQALRYARKDIQHDPTRHGMESLVFERGGDAMVRLVQLRTPSANAAFDEGESVSWLAGFSMLAVGDTESGWYFIRGEDGAHRLFHGASYARHIFSVNG